MNNQKAFKHISLTSQESIDASHFPPLSLLLYGTVQVATIVPAPTVQSSSREIYMKTTPKLAINGTNFNIKDTQLFFDPPLKEETVIQKQVEWI